MILQAFAVGRLEANCYVVGDEESREVMVIDPGDDVLAGEYVLPALAGLRGRLVHRAAALGRQVELRPPV